MTVEKYRLGEPFVKVIKTNDWQAVLKHIERTMSFMGYEMGSKKKFTGGTIPNFEYYPFRRCSGVFKDAPNGSEREKFADIAVYAKAISAEETEVRAEVSYLNRSDPKFYEQFVASMSRFEDLQSRHAQTENHEATVAKVSGDTLHHDQGSPGGQGNGKAGDATLAQGSAAAQSSCLILPK